MLWRIVNIGFFVNPLAGYGGTVNHKGSDNLILPDIEKSVSIVKALSFLDRLKTKDLYFFVPSGIMGEELLKRSGIEKYESISEPSATTTAGDTMDFVSNLCDRDVDILIFVGGDGTARDVLSSLRKDVPVMGIPSGVKMYSSVFAINVEQAAEFVNEISLSGDFETTKGEVVDIDEDMYRSGILEAKLFGELYIPISERIVGVSKAEYSESGTEGIVEYIIDNMKVDRCYIIGPGSTCKSILKELGYNTNILGFDLLKNKKLMGEDVGENRIYESASTSPVTLIISPIGGQGFVLGRGNKQISGRVLEKIGMENIFVIAAPQKMNDLDKLYVDIDTGPEFNVPKYVKVLYGYGRFRLLSLVS